MVLSDYISARSLRRFLEYLPDTGKLYWKRRARYWFASTASWRSWNAQNAGQEAFTHSARKGYKEGTLLGFHVLAHRMAWAIHYGRWPRNEIDHINGCEWDNRIENLRDVPRSINRRNSKKVASNTSGFNGVGRRKKRKDRKEKSLWYAVHPVTRRQSHFMTKKEAVACRKAMEKETGGFTERHGK